MRKAIVDCFEIRDRGTVVVLDGVDNWPQGKSLEAIISDQMGRSLLWESSAENDGRLPVRRDTY